jgi:hypothetical protein
MSMIPNEVVAKLIEDLEVQLRELEERTVAQAPKPETEE